MTTTPMTPEDLIETWYAATVEDSPDEGIMFALLRLARRYPQWFDAELTGDPLQMLFEASTVAQDDMVSRKIIEAAYWLVKANEDRLVDPPQPKTKPEPMPLTVPEPVAGLLRGIVERLDAGQEVVFLSSDEAYDKGRDAGYADGHADGYRAAVLRFAEAEHAARRFT